MAATYGSLSVQTRSASITEAQRRRFSVSRPGPDADNVWVDRFSCVRKKAHKPWRVMGQESHEAVFGAVRRRQQLLDISGSIANRHTVGGAEADTEDADGVTAFPVQQNPRLPKSWLYTMLNPRSHQRHAQLFK